jgi:hypothetical protein
MNPKLTALFLSIVLSTQAQPIYRQFGAKVIDIRQPSTLTTERGKVAWVQNGVVGLDAEKATSEVAIGSNVVPSDWEYDRPIAVTNYPAIGSASVGKEIFIKAIRIGTFRGYQDQPIDLYDCGSIYRPPPLTPEQVEVAKSAAKVRAAESRRRYLMGETNAFNFLLTEASNGSASAQCRLGEHYLSGIACETNLAKGIFWLTQSANNGSVDASNKLAALKR